MLHWTNQNWAKRNISQKTGQKDKTKRQDKRRDKKTGQTDKKQKATYKTAAELAVKNSNEISFILLVWFENKHLCISV